jgi:hypothetical protein
LNVVVNVNQGRDVKLIRVSEHRLCDEIILEDASESEEHRHVLEEVFVKDLKQMHLLLFVLFLLL